MLKIYGVSANNLKQYTVTESDKKFGIIKLPEEKYRVKGEEILFDNGPRKSTTVGIDSPNKEDASPMSTNEETKTPSSNGGDEVTWENSDFTNSRAGHVSDTPTMKSFDSTDTQPEDFGRGSVLIFKKETKKKKDYDVTSLGDF